MTTVLRTCFSTRIASAAVPTRAARQNAVTPVRQAASFFSTSSSSSHRLCAGAEQRRPRTRPSLGPMRSVRHLSSTTIKDPVHPMGLYFHPIPQQARYAISFLSQAPSSPTSASVIGYINDVGGDEKVYEVARQHPDRVQTHAAFLDLLHAALKDKAISQDGLLEYEAYLRKEGFAHVADPRHQLMPGRIPTPENIIGMVAFTDSTLRPETYERNDTYRIITYEEGFIQLRPNWQDVVLDKCKEAN